MSAKSNHNREIPQHIFNLVNEHTKSGFVLFYFNSEGEPRIVNFPDNQESFFALKQLISDWSDSISEISNESMTDSILNMNKEDEEED